MFVARFGGNTRVLRSDEPLTEDQMRDAAPSIFAAGKHAGRSERYTHIPTIDVLRGLRREGFELFLVAQGVSRIEGRSGFTRHMVRLRYGRGAPGRGIGPLDANEIVLINSHDGASSYRVLAGVFHFPGRIDCVVGDVVDEVRIAHKGDVRDEVIGAAFRVLGQFEGVNQQVEAMRTLMLEPRDEMAFASSALALRFGKRRSDEEPGLSRRPPLVAADLNAARRVEEAGHDLWATFLRVQENALRGGLMGRTVRGRRTRTRPVAAIDRSVGLSRALWNLAEEMRRLKG